MWADQLLFKSSVFTRVPVNSPYYVSKADKVTESFPEPGLPFRIPSTSEHRFTDELL